MFNVMMSLLHHLVTQVLNDNLEKSLERELKLLIKDGSIKDLDPAKLKLSAKNIQFSLADSRTDLLIRIVLKLHAQLI